MQENSYRTQYIELGALLFQAREETGLTQKQVEENLSLAQSDLSKIENGQRRVDFFTLFKLSKLYKKPLEFFIPKSLKNGKGQ